MIFLPSILVYINFHFVYFENFSGNQALMNHTVFPRFVQTPQNVEQTLYIKFALPKYEILDLPYLRTSKLDLPVVS